MPDPKRRRCNAGFISSAMPDPEQKNYSTKLRTLATLYYTVKKLSELLKQHRTFPHQRENPFLMYRYGIYSHGLSCFPPIFYQCKRRPQCYLTDEKIIKFSSYRRKFRVEQLESHIWGRASLYVRKCANISPHMRRPYVIYHYATAPFWISVYMRQIRFLFYQCYVI